MRNFRAIGALVAVLGLAACSEGQLVGRGADSDHSLVSGLTGGLVHPDTTLVPVAYHVTRVDVIVPRTLYASESNSLIPIADIVWHGDPPGDRHAQVQALIAEAADRATASMTNGPPVEVSIQITRFHALTPRARYTTGGNYATHFILTVRDAASGIIIDGPRPVAADCHGSGGERAVQEEDAGITQKMVIEARVAQVLANELSHRVAPVAEAKSEAAGVAMVSRDVPPPGEVVAQGAANPNGTSLY